MLYYNIDNMNLFNTFDILDALVILICFKISGNQHPSLKDVFVKTI